MVNRCSEASCIYKKEWERYLWIDMEWFFQEIMLRNQLKKCKREYMLTSKSKKIKRKVKKKYIYICSSEKARTSG